MTISGRECNIVDCLSEPDVREYVDRIRIVALQRPSDKEARRRFLVAHRFFLGLDCSCPRRPFQLLSQPQTASQEGRNDGVLGLPTEIYLKIFGYFVDWNDEMGMPHRTEGIETLLSLARTCKPFQLVAEDFLYRRAAFMGYLKPLWRFQFTITIEPRRASLVRSLYLWWESESDHHKRLIDITRACPNLSSLALRWVRLPPYLSGLAGNSSRCGELLKKLLQSCPKVRIFRFSGPSSLECPEVAAPDIDHEQFYRQLTELETDTSSEWAWHTLRYYKFSNLTTLHLGQVGSGSVAPHKRRLLPKVVENLPRLRKLDLSVGLGDFTSLKNACAAWESTLQHLCLHTYQHKLNSIGKLIALLPALEELLVLENVSLTGEMIEGITKSSSMTKTRLRTVVLGSLSQHAIPKTYPMVGEPIDQALQSMIETLHPTLETLYLGYHWPVQRQVLEQLKRAKNLRQLRIHLIEDTTQDIDGLAGSTKLDRLRPMERPADDHRLYHTTLIAGEVLELRRWGAGQV